MSFRHHRYLINVYRPNRGKSWLKAIQPNRAKKRYIFDTTIFTGEMNKETNRDIYIQLALQHMGSISIMS